MNYPERSAFSEMGKRASDLPISWLMEKALQKPGIVSLAAGFTDNHTLPLQLTSEVVNELLDDEPAGRKALQYGTTRGDEKLRTLIASMVDDNDASASPPSVPPSNVVVTHGSQQFLYLFCELVLDEGDVVIVEDPTYFVLLGLFRNRGIDVRGVRSGEQGIDIDSLEDVLKTLESEGRIDKLKFVYAVTYFQNPTGLTTPAANKLDVLDMVEKWEPRAGHHIYYLEDAAYMHLGFEGHPPPTSMAFEKHRERVVFSSTFSKPYSTGIRVGYGILPASLVNPLLFIKTNHDFGTSNFLQSIMARAIETGRYQTHLAVIRKRYFEKCTLLHESMLASFPEWARWVRPDGGLYIWVELPAHIETSLNSRFFEKALENEVLYVPGGLCFSRIHQDGHTSSARNATMRLSFGGATEESITAGARRLGDTLHQWDQMTSSLS
jgi:2-aminoadipate transaminase